MTETKWTEAPVCASCRGTHFADTGCVSHWRSEAGRLEVEAEKIAEVTANMSGAITGNLKTHIAYPGKPFRPIEEALVLRRATERMAVELIQLRRPLHLRATVDVTEDDVHAEIVRQVKAAEKEVPS